MVNPLSLATGYKASGGLGGFLAGMQDSYGIANADRDLIDRDIKTKLDQLRLQNEELDQPLKAIKRANEIATGEYEQGQWASGEKQGLLKAEHEAKLAAAVASKSDAEVKDMYNQATGMASMASLFDDNDMKPENQLLAAQKWEHAKEIAGRVGLKNFPQEYSIQNLQKLMAGGKFATSTIPFLQKTALVKQEGDIKSGHIEQQGLIEDRQINSKGEWAVKAAAAGASARQTDPTTKNESSGREAEALSLQIRQMSVVPIDMLRQYVALSVDKDDKYTKQLTERAKEYRTRFMTDTKDKEAEAAKLGLPKETPYTVIAAKAAERDTSALIEKLELSKFEGKTVDLGGGKTAKIVGGELKPVGGGSAPAGASKPAAPAAAAKPTAAAPATENYASVGPNTTADMLNASVGGEEEPAPATKATAPTVTTKDEYDKLPSGARYTAPDGREYVKK